MLPPPCSLGGLKLKPQYFGHLMRRASSLGKTLTLGEVEGRRRREQQRMRWFDGITDSVDMSLQPERTLGASEGQGNLVCCSPWGRRVGHDLATEQQQPCSVGFWLSGRTVCSMA